MEYTVWFSKNKASNLFGTQKLRLISLDLWVDLSSLDNAFSVLCNLHFINSFRFFILSSSFSFLLLNSSSFTILDSRIWIFFSWFCFSSDFSFLTLLLATAAFFLSFFRSWKLSLQNTLVQTLLKIHFCLSSNPW